MLMQSVNLLSSFYWAVSVFVVAQYEDTLLNHPFVCVPNSDCSGGFGGLSRRWGRRRRRWWGRAVPQEATPPELIRLTPLCLVAVDGHSCSYPPSSGRLSGSRPACAICSSPGGDRKQSSAQLTLPLLIPAPRFSTAGGRWRASLLDICSCSISFCFTFCWRLHTLLSSFWGGTPCPLCKITPPFFW